jgi:cytochrome c-type biogenesis protein CcmH/NrfF
VPRATGLDSLVWALPAFAGVCAFAGLVVAFRRWKRAADTVPTDADRVLVAEARETDLDES